MFLVLFCGVNPSQTFLISFAVSGEANRLFFRESDRRGLFTTVLLVGIHRLLWSLLGLVLSATLVRVWLVFSNVYPSRLK